MSLIDHTNEWPTEVTNRAATPDIPPGVSDLSGSDAIISELAVEIKPRYVRLEMTRSLSLST